MEQQYQEEDRDFFKKIIRILNLPSFADVIVCLGDTMDLNARKIYILGKTPSITDLIIEILSASPIQDRVRMDRRYYVDVAGMNEQEVHGIQEIIKSGLLEFRSFILSVLPRASPEKNAFSSAAGYRLRSPPLLFFSNMFII